MLPRKYRLTAEKDYARIFAKGRPMNGRGLGLKIMRNGLDVTRIGFIVSTKVNKRAVVRNLVKRRMREIARKRQERIDRGFDIVFMARSEAPKMPFKDLENAMHELLVRAGVLKNI